MSKRKPKVEAWAWVETDGTVHPFQGRRYPCALQRASGGQGSIVCLVPADPLRDAEIKALRRLARSVVKHYVSHGSRTHSSTCDVCAAVEKMQRSKK